MKKDFSPEEKLLRLIKGSARKDAEREKMDIRSAMAYNGTAATSSYKGNGRSAQKSASMALAFDIKAISTKNVNPVLVIILIGLLIYFLVDMIYNPYRGKEDKVESAVARETLEVKEKADSSQPYSYYTPGIDDRNIFMPQESDTPAMPAGPSVEEIGANLSLIGIIAGDKPQAIIEDKKAGKSYFLYKGGSAGQAKIVEIMEDRVLMEYRDETFELVL
ncbi:MAG: hypothetical protein KKD29_00675 [Candidatus Omnitrophica bacterium]|nr:hypothetical protein [Candidatus Omnitrophota bacterium]MBU4487972.1 hypothetical protein [Candidatus Omnitrophota bacterium]MCG2705228.1 hypothetical protein [Candidatus Omnitrophota bacterium]